MFKTIVDNVDGDRYYYHRIVKSMFENETPKYFYLDHKLTIFSENQPTNPFTNNVDVVSTEQVINDLSGTKIFTIDICPEKRSIKTKKKTLIEKENVPNWLSDKIQSIGAKILNQNIVNKHVDKFVQTKNDNMIVKKYYTIIGVLEIENQELFNQQYLNGIGSGKTWGFGIPNLM